MNQHVHEDQNTQTLTDQTRLVSHYMQELQKLKRVQIDQDSDQDTDSNPLSLKIQAKVVLPTLKVFKEKFDGTTDPTNHVVGFESTLDLYGALNARNS